MTTMYTSVAAQTENVLLSDMPSHKDFFPHTVPTNCSEPDKP